MLPHPVGFNLVELDEIDSTNSYAARLLFDELPVEGTAITAQYQHAGKGQRSATWESVKGKNLLVSYILYPKFLLPSQFFLLNEALALGIRDAIRNYTSEKVVIKWPNDILVGSRKISGMLVENSIRNMRFNSTIAGIGINVNQDEFEEYVPAAVSLKNITGNDIALKKVFKSLNNGLTFWYNSLRNGRYKHVHDAYNQSLFRYNELGYYESEGDYFEGYIRGVNLQGQLQIVDRAGNAQLFNSKEVRFLF
jgi:BirA family transcriptional regulator, biotin operon repressor / biotin---[acetyl-CoA-carboxylase] ligase